MGYEVVDIEKSSRKNAYKKFIDAANPMMTMTAKVDISKLYRFSKKGYKLNVLLLYVLLKAAEKNEYFYYELKDKQLLKFDKLSTNLVIYGKDDNLYYITIPNADNYFDFEKTYTSLVNEHRESCSHYVIEDSALISTSAVVSYPFESIVCGHTDDFLSNFVTWGKYEKTWRRVTLNMSFRFHHVLMDGREVGKFFCDLKEVIANFKLSK